MVSLKYLDDLAAELFGVLYWLGSCECYPAIVRARGRLDSGGLSLALHLPCLAEFSSGDLWFPGVSILLWVFLYFK